MTLGDRVRAFLFWLAGTLAGLLCLFVAVAFCVGWIGPGLGLRLLQVLVAVVIGGVGFPVGVVLVVSSARAALEREWHHPPLDGRGGAATTRRGRLLRASGGGRVHGDPIAVPPNALDPVEAFAHYSVLRRALPREYGFGRSPPRVDVAMAAAVLSLAGQGRVQIRVPRDVSWSHDGAAVTRTEVVGLIEVRRADVAPVAPMDDGLDARLLRALSAPSVPASPREATLPYRASAPVEESPAEGPWVRLRDAVATITRGDAGFRRVLRARMLAAVPPDEALRPAEVVGAEFAATVGATGDRGLGAALVREIEQGFAARR